jgi:CBS domain-containing protein
LVQNEEGAEMTQLRVSDLMSRPVVAVRPSSRLSEVIETLENNRIRHVPVVDEGGRVLGLISHRDVLRSQESSLSKAPAADQDEMNRWMEARWLMTREVRTTRPDESALEAALTLRSSGCGSIPVVEEGKLVGMLTEADFVEYAIRTLSDPGR